MARVARRTVISDISSFDRFEQESWSVMGRLAARAGLELSDLERMDVHSLRHEALAGVAARTGPALVRALACTLQSLKRGVDAERAKHNTSFMSGEGLTTQELLTRDSIQDLVLLAQVLAGMGDANAASFCLRTVSNVVYEDPFPHFHENRAVYDFCAYQCRRALGSVQAASVVYANHLAHVHRRFGKGQLDASRLQMQLALCHMQMGKAAPALAYMEAALATQQAKLPRSHPQVIRTTVMAGTLSDLNGKDSAAAKHYTAARDLIRATSSGRAGRLGEAQVNLRLGRLLAKQGRLHDAQDLVRDAYDCLNSLLGGQDAKTIMARRTLNAVRSKLGLRGVQGSTTISPAQAARQRQKVDMGMDFDFGMESSEPSSARAPAAPSLDSLLESKQAESKAAPDAASDAASIASTAESYTDSDSDDDIFGAGRRGGSMGGMAAPMGVMGGGGMGGQAGGMAGAGSVAGSGPMGAMGGMGGQAGGMAGAGSVAGSGPMGAMGGMGGQAGGMAGAGSVAGSGPMGAMGGMGGQAGGMAGAGSVAGSGPMGAMGGMGGQAGGMAHSVHSGSLSGYEHGSTSGGAGVAGQGIQGQPGQGDQGRFAQFAGGPMGPASGFAATGAAGGEMAAGFSINGNAVSSQARAMAATLGHEAAAKALSMGMVQGEAGGYTGGPAGAGWGGAQGGTPGAPGQHGGLPRGAAGGGSEAHGAWTEHQHGMAGEFVPGSGAGGGSGAMQGYAGPGGAGMVRGMSRLQATEFGRVNATIEALTLQAEAAGGELPPHQREALRAALATRSGILQQAISSVPDATRAGSEAIRQKAYDLGVEPETGESKYAYGDVDSATLALGDVVHNLSSALSGLLTAARVSRSRTRAAAVGSSEAAAETTARWTGDGTIAFGSTADEALADPAADLSAHLAHAIQALAASNEVPADGGGAGSSKLEALRQTLFGLVADVGESVQEVLRDSNIRTSELRVIAAAAAQGIVTQAEASGGGGSHGVAGAGRGGAGAMGVQALEGAALTQGEAGLDAAQGVPVDPAAATYGMKEALRRMREGEDGGGWDPANAGQRTMLRPDEKAQRGLWRSEANLTGRRMKAVAMTATDILDALKQKLMVVGLFRSLGSKKRQARTSAKVFSIGCFVRELRMRAWRRRGVMCFMLGYLQGAVRRRDRSRRRTKTWLAGHLRNVALARRARLRATKVAAVGAAVRAIRIRDFKRRCTVLFALGVFPMWKRTEGNPKGFVPPKATKSKKRPPKLHWDNLKNVEGTIWEGAGSLDTRTLSHLFGDLRDMFEKKPKAKTGGKGGKGGKGGTKKKKPKKVEITWISDPDGNRQQNMGIAVSRLKNFGFANLAQAVVDMDLSATPSGDDTVEVLMLDLVQPTDSDRENALKATSDEGLGLCEQFLYHMVRVPRCQERLKCMVAKRNFPEKFEAVARDVDVCDKACKEIITSDKLRRVLTRYVLPFGNALNEGSKAAGAKGVRLTVISKLANTKTAKNPRMTMLDYLITKIHQHDPDLLTLYADFSAVREATRVQDAIIKEGMTSSSKDVKLLQSALEKAAEANDEVFMDRMEQFTTDAAAKVEALQAKHKVLEEDFIKTVTYVGESLKNPQLGAVFSVVNNFAKTFNDAAVKYTSALEKAEKDARLAAAKAARMAGKPKKPRRAKPKKGPAQAAGGGGAAAS